MPTSTRPAKLRVINDNVDLGGGISLPRGDYDGKITDTIVPWRGQEIREPGSKVTIYLSEAFLQQIGFPPKPSWVGIEADFTPAFKRGDIIEVA